MEMNLIFEPKNVFVPNSTAMCFVNDQLVVRGKPFGRRRFQLNLYSINTGKLVGEITTGCNHWLSGGSRRRKSMSCGGLEKMYGYPRVQPDNPRQHDHT